MRIMPINNNQPLFGAKLPKSDMNTLLDAALGHDKEAGIPKLYTLLERLEKMPGEKAELKTWVTKIPSEMVGYSSRNSDSTCQLRIDNQLQEEGRDVFDTLYCAVTSEKTKNGKKIHMPKNVFDLMWWVNRDKSAEDIETLLRD